MSIFLVGNIDAYLAGLSTVDRHDISIYLCSVTGIATEFHVLKGSGTGNMKVNVYDISGGEPNNLLWAKDTSTYIDESTEIIPIDTPFLVEAGNYYGLGFNQDTANVGSESAASGGDKRYKNGQTYSTFTAPDPAGTGFSTGTHVNRFALYGRKPGNSLFTLGVGF